jgi:Mg/Co/Ni transporter MgtE
MRRLIYRTVAGLLFGMLIGGVCVSALTFAFAGIMDFVNPPPPNMADSPRGLFLMGLLWMGVGGVVMGAITGASVGLRNLLRRETRTGALMGTFIGLLLVSSLLFSGGLSIQLNVVNAFLIGIFVVAGAIVGGVTPYLTSQRSFQDK